MSTLVLNTKYKFPHEIEKISGYTLAKAKRNGLYIECTYMRKGQEYLEELDWFDTKILKRNKEEAWAGNIFLPGGITYGTILSESSAELAESYAIKISGEVLFSISGLKFVLGKRGNKKAIWEYYTKAIAANDFKTPKEGIDILKTRLSDYYNKHPNLNRDITNMILLGRFFGESFSHGMLSYGSSKILPNNPFVFLFKT